MAEYYPLLARAVAGLPNSTPELRRSVYDRARKALLAQLRNLDPPLAEADVTRETEALDGAVARLEAELAAVNSHAVEEPLVAATVAPPPKAPGGKIVPPLSPAPRTMTPPLRPAAPALGAAPPPLPAVAKVGGRPGAAEPPEPEGVQDELRPAKAPERRQGTNTPPATPQQPQPRERQGPQSADNFGEFLAADVAKPRVEGVRLYAPQQSREESRSGVWLWVVGGVVAVVVAIVAVAAWTLRDRPDQLAHLNAANQPEVKTGGKMVERIGGAEPESASPAPQVATSAPAAANPAPQAPATSSQTAVAAAGSPALTPDTPAPKPAATTGQTIPVAQRAALLVQAPNEPNKVKTYVGTVIWRLDNVSGGAGQPLGTAVKADIDIPGDKWKVELTLQKNMDASLPASHTITVVFSVQPDSPTGGVKQINVPQLRQDDAPSGDALIGVPVPIMENSFLIGLTRGNAEATNLDLIKTRAWFDIPILLGNSKIAKLTFEKNTTGTQAIDEAIAAWQAQQ